MSLSDAIETILDNDDIRAAIVSYLKANEPTPNEPHWREVWRQVEENARTVTIEMPARGPQLAPGIYMHSPSGLTPQKIQVNLLVVCLYSDERNIASIEGFAVFSMPENQPFMGWLFDNASPGLRVYHYATAVHNYTEAIELTQTNAHLAMEALQRWEPPTENDLSDESGDSDF